MWLFRVTVKEYSARLRRNQSSIHRRDTEFAEIGVFFDQEIFSLRPRRLRGELSETFVLKFEDPEI
jgi:hypothetical protein